MAKRNLAELKIPAAPEFIPVAKRVAVTLGGQLGLSLMDLDELSIALTQACDSAIGSAHDLGMPAELKLTYFATNRALVVDVDLMPTGAALPLQVSEHEHEQERPRAAAPRVRDDPLLRRRLPTGDRAAHGTCALPDGQAPGGLSFRQRLN